MRNIIPHVVGLSGLEPPTSRLSGVRSNQLSYKPILKSYDSSGDEEIRTLDPLLAKQVLSQLSYTPIFFYNGDAPFLRIYKTLKIKQRLKVSSCNLTLEC